jgi:hypothetical protein
LAAHVIDAPDPVNATHVCFWRPQYDEVEGHEKFADDFQQAMTYYTKQSLMGGDVELQDAYDWRAAKVRLFRNIGFRF